MRALPGMNQGNGAGQPASVSVVIVNWNSGHFLETCLPALSSQTVKPRQVLVIDNGSLDRKTDKMEKRYPEVEFVRLKKNIGFAAANNLGASLAKGSEWLALLNPDAFPEPSWLSSLLAASEKHPQFSFFGSRMLSAEEPSRLDGTGDVYHTSGLVWRRGHGRRVDKTGTTCREIFSPCAAAALYRLEPFLEAGGFDEDYFCYLEDVDLGFRLRLLGHRCLYVPEAVVHHVGSATTGRHSDFSIYHGHRNLVWTYLKDMPAPLLLFYLPQHLLLNAFSLFWFGAHGRAHAILKAKRDALKGLPRVLRKRRRIQTGRKASSFDLKALMEKGWITRK
jgi:GT2 family glycosyltransferase